jgi:hypothetical protein
MHPLLSILLSAVALLALGAFLFWLDRATAPSARGRHHDHLIPPQPRTWRGVRGS